MFSINVEQLELMDALKKVKNTIGKGKDANNPYDKKLYMECIESNGQPVLRMVTTNLSEVSDIKCEIVSNSGDFEACSLVDFTTFFNLIDTIESSTELTITDKEPGKVVQVDYKGRKKPIEFAATNSNQFAITSIDETYSTVIKMNCGDFKECLDKAGSVIVESDTYPIYNCVHFVIQNGQVITKAMDAASTKRMSLYSKMITHTGDGEFFIEASKLKRVIGSLDLTKDVEIKINDNVAVLEQDEMKFLIRLVSGVFSDIAKFMPNQYKIEATFNRDEAITALKRVKIMSEQGSAVRSCLFSIDNVFTNVDINTKIGSISELITTQLNGDPLEMGFAIDSLLSTLYAMTEPDIKMCFYASQCCVIMPANAKGYIHRILVPAMVNRKA